MPGKTTELISVTPETEERLHITLSLRFSLLKTATLCIYRVTCNTIMGSWVVSSITSEAPTDMKFYYQWRNNFSLKTFTRGRKQYAHYNTLEKKHVN